MILTLKGGELTIESRSTIVGGDIHAPQHSWDMIDSACAEGCKLFICNGDFFNLDSMSEYARKQLDSGWKTEKACARMIFHRLLESFQDVVLLLGNHDNRIGSKTGHAFDYNEIVELTVPERDRDRIHVTDRDYVYLLDSERKWRICHSREYSRTPGSKAELMGRKYNCNVILGHSHILSCKTVFSGQDERYYIDGGCMLDYNKVEYECMNTSTFTNWANGYVRLVDGNVMMVADDPIKWEKVKYEVNADGKFGTEQTLWERIR